MFAVRTPVKNAVILVLFTTLFATLSAFYFENTPIPHFFSTVKSAAIALIIAWSAGGLGSCVLQWGNPPKGGLLTPLESFLFSETIGFGLLASTMFLLGVVKAWVPGAAWALLLLGVLASGPFLNHLRAMRATRAQGETLPLALAGPLIAFTAAALVSFLIALAPITYYDSLVYHLALPSAYLHAQGWVGLPHLIYSAFPQNGEMLWTLGLLAGNDTVVNLIGWEIGLLLLAAVFSFGKRFLDPASGGVAAALIALMPAFLLLSVGGYIDVTLTLFCFMSLYAACLWMQAPSAALVLYAALFSGWAMGTKYTGGLPAFITGLIFLQKPEHRGRAFLSYVGVSSAVLAPWLIKNTLYVGNPVFPFFYNWGIQKLNPWMNQAAAGYFAGITEYHSRALWELPWVLWNLAVNGLGFGRGMDVLGDFGWLPLFALIPALWLARKRVPALQVLALFSGLFFVVWAVNRPVLRFLFPICPMLALLAAWGWVHGIGSQPRVLRAVSRGFIGVFLVSGFFLFFEAVSVVAPFGVALGLEDRDSYLLRQLNYYGAAHFINTQTPPASHVYVFGDQRSYYYQRQLSVSPVFSRDRLTDWANQAAAPRDVERQLKAHGVTHLVVNRAEYERLGSYLYTRFTEQGLRHWTGFLKARKPVYRDTACDVYDL